MPAGPSFPPYGEPESPAAAPEPPRPARDLATLTREIRLAWLVATTAIRLPSPVANWSLDDPELFSVVQARDQAFSWALDELIDGTYLTPRYQVTALESGVLPAPETDQPGDHEQDHVA